MQIGHLIAGIDRRCEPGSIYRVDEFGKGAAMTGSDAVDGDVFEHQRHHRSRHLEAVEGADLIDVTADRRDLYGLPEVRTTDKFHDMVGAAIAGHSKDSFYPIVLSAVDAHISTQRDGTFELVGATGDDHMRAMQFGDLNAEQRNTAGALDQYRLAGMYVTTLDKREPCRQPSARQGGGFDVAQCCWRVNQPLLRDCHVFGENTRVETAECAVRRGAGIAWAEPVNPVRGERRDDTVALAEPKDVVSQSTTVPAKSDPGVNGKASGKSLPLSTTILSR